MSWAATGSPSAGRAGCWASRARPSGGRPASPTTSRGWSGGWSSWPRQYGRYGYRRVTALLRAEGFAGEPQAGRAAVAAGGPEGAAAAADTAPAVAQRRVVRAAPAGPREPRLELRLRASAGRSDGRAFRMLTVIDEFTRECLAIDVARTADQRRRAGAAERPVRAAGAFPSTSGRTTGRSSRPRRSEDGWAGWG